MPGAKLKKNSIDEVKTTASNVAYGTRWCIS